VAVAVLAVLVVTVGRRRVAPERPVFRGDEGAALEFVSVERTAAGTLRVSWHRVEGLDGYRLVLLDATFREAARTALRPDTTAEVDLSAVPARVPRPLWWQVLGFSRGDPVLSSPPRPVPPR
jgi:hypothetical protein